MPAAKPKAREGITMVELDGEAVLYDDEGGDLHHLNRTATLVFGLCDGTGTAKELSIDLSQVFGVPVAEVEPQVRRLIREFRKAGLLEPGANGKRTATRER